MNPYSIPGIRRKPQTQENRIIDRVKLYYKVDCLSENLWARQVAMWIMRKRMKSSWRKIALCFESKASTVRHSIKKVSDEITSYEEVRKEVRQVVETIYP
jgi:chromosomal replication initiation ATPase DnaA